MKQYSVGKWLMWAVVVLLPAIAVGLSNKKVFPSSFWLATILLAVSVLASAIILYYADKADRTIGWYCVVVEGLLSIVIFINLGSHFQLGREIDETITATTDRHIEEDREEKRKEAESRRKKITDQAEKERLDSQAKLLRSLPRDRRYLPTPVPPSEIEPFKPVQSEKPALVPIRTREVVLLEWNPLLTWLAFLEAGIAILGGFGLGIAWRIDRDKNGVPDWIERQAKRMPKKQFEQVYPQYAGRNLAHPEIENSGQNPDNPLPFSPTIRGFLRDESPENRPKNDPKKPPEIARKNRPKNDPLAGSENRPTESPEEWGNFWGEKFPVIDGVRWEGKPDKKVVECWTKNEQRKFLGQFSRRGENKFSDLSKNLPERKRQILALIGKWKSNLE